MMTEQEYILNGFEKNFSAFKGKRILLHGSRDYAGQIIEKFGDSFHFAGVMSREEISGPVFWGIPVFDEKMLADLKPDLLILTERVKYAEEVYRDVNRTCRESGISLFNMYGVDEIKMHDEIASFDSLNEEGWKQVCAGYDVVSFETMDTFCYPLKFASEAEIRPVFRELFEWLAEQGKEVIFCLRKSYPEDEQISILRNLSLMPDIDSHLIFRRGEDLSFRSVRERFPGRKILHIGQGLINECYLPRCYGIDTRRFVVKQYDSLAPVGSLQNSRFFYDPSRKEKILEKIAECDVISFDIFDTLLVRKTLFPQDVHELTEKKAVKAGLLAEGFAAKRIAAEQETVHGTLDEIYECLVRQYGLDRDLAAACKSLELETEREVLVPRQTVVSLLDFAVRTEKQVVLTSDMYLSSALLEDILSGCGVTGYDKILVSCEYRCGKQEGLFRKVTELCGENRKILHIGDNKEADGAAEKYGLEVIIIPAALSLARSCGWDKAVRAAGNLTERGLLGLVVSKRFEDPFQNPNLTELPGKERLLKYASGVAAPLAAGFLTWLVEKVCKDHYDGILFLARDGRLLQDLYTNAVMPRAEAEIRQDLPEGIYFYANRHASFMCCADDPSGFAFAAEYGKRMQLDAAGILENIYGVKAEEVRPQAEGESLKEYLSSFRPLLSGLAEKARNGMNLYAEKCGVRKDGRYAVVDLISTGTTMNILQQVLPCSLHGTFFATTDADTRRSGIEYYLQGENDTLLNNYIELETFFSSEEPSLERISGDGEPVFAEEVRDPQDLEEFRLVYDEARRVAEEFFRLFYIPGESVQPLLPEEMFAADGYHGVQRFAYDDWAKVPIKKKEWQDG